MRSDERVLVFVVGARHRIICMMALLIIHWWDTFQSKEKLWLSLITNQVVVAAHH